MLAVFKLRSRTGQSTGTKEECVTVVLLVRAPKIKVQTNGGSSSLPYT